MSAYAVPIIEMPSRRLRVQAKSASAAIPKAQGKRAHLLQILTALRDRKGGGGKFRNVSGVSFVGTGVKRKLTGRARTRRSGYTEHPSWRGGAQLVGSCA